LGIELFKILCNRGFPVTSESQFIVSNIKEFITQDPKISVNLVSEHLKLDALNVDLTLFILEHGIIDSDVWDKTFA